MPSIVLSMLRSRPPRDTAVTVDMTAQTFLHAVEGSALVAAHEKPKWSEILKVDEKKLVEFVCYCIVFFDAKKKDFIDNTRNRGSMAGKATAFRITDVKMAYILSCIKVYVWPTVLQNHTAKRVQDLEAMFRRGALDEKMKQVASVMSEDFQPADLSWVMPTEVAVQPGQATSVDLLERQTAEKECICIGTVWRDFDTHA